MLALVKFLVMIHIVLSWVLIHGDPQFTACQTRTLLFCRDVVSGVVCTEHVAILTSLESSDEP